jgi:hypothetical protein
VKKAFLRKEVPAICRDFFVLAGRICQKYLSILAKVANQI